ncbi:hypothetical protein GCL60_16750 [Silvanigrella paludirubra]|uniref:Uncharacterized protein n=1 Tax=Silvanigrella paludirubra TaxID=2499159 RepID=A0A6N6VSV4_9BACT|nr:hypothetical protein [Silvanigrella paludirubra]KAB8035879.1 hypothetical protein GCL60_16750 [Silvanigrella paludirubra]
MNNTESIENLKDENNQLKIEIDNLKRDKKLLINTIEKMASQARSQLHSLEKTLDLFRVFNQKIKCAPPSGVERPKGSLDESNIIKKSWRK